MNFIYILKILASIATAATGLLAFIQPSAAYGFIGLEPVGVRGVSEIRAIFGGLFIGLGVAPFFLGENAYRMLGVGYLAIALTRTFSIIFDKSFAQSNMISLVTEIILGVILII